MMKDETQWLDQDALRPGDILLSMGSGKLGQLISKVDGSRYSHAALWTGSDVVEAVMDGVTRVDLGHSIREHGRVFVDVYRHQSAANCEPIVQAALPFVGGRYGFGDLALAGLVLGFTSAPKEAAVREAWLQYGGQVVAQLRRLDLPGTETMICSELVATACWNADPDTETYALQLRLSGKRSSADDVSPAMQCRGTSAIDKGWAQLATSAAATYRELRVGKAETAPDHVEGSANYRDSFVDRTRDLPLRSVHVAASPGLSNGLAHHRDFFRVPGRDWPLSFVTPRDLATSPSLRLLGRLRT